MSGENLDKATDTTGGLRNTQAALNLVKSKMQQNAATPESGTLQSLQADSRSVSVMGTEIARSIVKRKSVNKLNRRRAAGTGQFLRPVGLCAAALTPDQKREFS